MSKAASKAKAEALKRYRVRVPKNHQTALGHGQPAPDFVLTKDGQRFVFADGDVVQASTNCDPQYEVANMEHDPPLVRTSIIDQYSELFEPIGETASED